MDHRQKEPNEKENRSCLNDDVFMEILSHLPVQFLVRFKTVCKSWCNIINSSAFKQLHAQNYSYNNNDDEDGDNMFLQFDRIRGDKFTWKLSAIFPDQQRHTGAFPDSFQTLFNKRMNFCQPKILGPVNGLICVYEKSSFINGVIGICNPVLGEIRILPVPTTCLTKSWRKIGFGFDYVTKEYKVVQLLSNYTISGAQLYSSKTNTWRELATETLVQKFIIRRPIESPYKNGALALWLVERRDVDAGGCFPNQILSFDMHNEVFEEMLPCYYTTSISIRCKVKVFPEAEAIVRLQKPEWGRMYWWKKYELKVDEENQRSWGNILTIGPFRAVTPVALQKRRHGVVFKQRNYPGQNRILFYDYDSGKIQREIQLPGSVKRFKIIQYKGSLISP